MQAENSLPPPPFTSLMVRSLIAYILSFSDLYNYGLIK